MTRDSNDLSFMRHDYKPPVPDKRDRITERVWTLRRGPHERAAGLIHHGEGYGCEVQIFEDRQFLFGQRCEHRAIAVKVAEDLKAAAIAEGWSDA